MLAYKQATPGKAARPCKPIARPCQYPRTRTAVQAISTAVPDVARARVSFSMSPVLEHIQHGRVILKKKSGLLTDKLARPCQIQHGRADPGLTARLTSPH